MPKLPNEDWKVIAVRSPAAMVNSQVFSDVVDMSKYRAVIAILLLGDMAAETIDFSLQTDTVAAFNVDTQTLVAATQLAASAANNDSRQVVLQAVVLDVSLVPRTPISPPLSPSGSRREPGAR